MAAGVGFDRGDVAFAGISELAEQIFDMPGAERHPYGCWRLSDIVIHRRTPIGVGLIIYGNNQWSGDSIYRRQQVYSAIVAEQ